MYTNWDDLRFFLAVARQGSIRGGALTLGVNHSTVSRRIAGFESRVGVRLFERLPTGYVLTDSGHEMRASVERIEDEVASLGRRVLGRDTRLGGSIRVAVPGVMLTRLAPEIAAFSRHYPGIEVSIATGETYVSLSKREADVAIRTTDRPPDTLVGRRICRLAMAPYASLEYLAANPDVRELRHHDWVRLDDSWQHIAMEKWITRNIPPTQIHVRVNSGASLQEMIANGCGVGWTACYIAEADARMVRVGDPVPDFASAIWVLTHADLRRTARIGRFMEFMSEAIAKDMTVAEGVELAPLWGG
ncbi:MAG: DNA-binding transcriptional LysR family regulator [Kiritimatiellia bacterium]|jgi:DNA-binding transcriptional LysR family regulator